jgi:hypothetical protein
MWSWFTSIFRLRANDVRYIWKRKKRNVRKNQQYNNVSNLYLSWGVFAER